MENDDSPVFNELLDSWRKQLDAKQAKYRETVESAPYQDEVKRLRQITMNFLTTLRSAWFVTTRAGDWVDRSMFMRSVDDLSQSAVMVQTAITEGARNTARREMRYVIELAVKSLYVDQQMPTSNFATRLIFFDQQIKAGSMTPLDHLDFHVLTSDEGKKVVQKLWKGYSRASQFVHPSKSQIQERLSLAESGITPGFETADQLRQSNDEVFENFSLVLVLVFEAIGGSFSGDIWETGGLSDQDDWIYHAHPCVAAVDEQFDYKAERQERLESIKQRRKERLAKNSRL